MVLSPGQWRYPDPDEPMHWTNPHATAHRLYGIGSADELFHGAPRTTAPWPKAGGIKGERLWDQDRVTSALQQPPRLEEMDPRALHATQAHVTRSGVNYYMGDLYLRTGQTFADHTNVGNTYPTVYSDRRGRNLLLSGHHRAAAALLRGTPLRARHITEED